MLVIGSSASAFDIAFLLSKTSKVVYFSKHLPAGLVKFKPQTFPANVFIRPDVQEITETGALFTDDTSASVDTIIYCTGFNYSFPFMSVDCGISVNDNYVQHLYKHVINIKYPTMAFIGITFLSLFQDMISLQSRFVLKFWSEGKVLPNATEMLEDEQKEREKRIDLGWGMRHYHKLGIELMEKYFTDLAESAGIDPVRQVNIGIYYECVQQFLTNFEHFREQKYEILDDTKFVRSAPEN